MRVRHMLRCGPIAALLAFASEPAAAQRECGEHRHPVTGERFHYEPFVVFFDFDSAEIAPAAAGTLANAAALYRTLAQCPVLIFGHADRAGPADYNLALSRRRAEAVADWLRRHGVSSPVRVEAFGETRTLGVAPDGVPEPHDRRAELMIVPESGNEDGGPPSPRGAERL